MKASARFYLGPTEFTSVSLLAVTVHGVAAYPRNVAAEDLDGTNSLKSATLWGGIGGGETRQIAVSRPSDP